MTTLRDFKIGDYVIATGKAFFGTEYAAGDRGTVAGFRDNCLLINRPDGAPIVLTGVYEEAPIPFGCDPANWEPACRTCNDLKTFCKCK